MYAHTHAPARASRTHAHAHPHARALRTRIVRLISRFFPRMLCNLKPPSKPPFKPFKTRFLDPLYGR